MLLPYCPNCEDAARSYTHKQDKKYECDKCKVEVTVTNEDGVLKVAKVYKQDLSLKSTPVKKSRVLCPFCDTEINGDDNYCLACGKKI